MTYGQTGSGKTFTMSGDSGNYQVPCRHTKQSRPAVQTKYSMVHSSAAGYSLRATTHQTCLLTAYTVGCPIEERP